MRYSSVTFRASDEEKEALRELAKEQGTTVSKLCHNIVREHCLECDEDEDGQILGEADLDAIAEAVAERLNGSTGGGGELPQSQKLDDYIRKAADKNGLSRAEVIARLLSYAIHNVSFEADFVSNLTLTTISGITNKL